MDDGLIITIAILGLIALILIATYFVKKWQKKKVSSFGLVPEEILVEFDLAEKMLKESHGERTPYDILWELSNKQRVDRNESRLNNMKGGQNGETKNGTKTGSGTAYSGANTSGFVSTEPRVESSSSDGESQRRQDIQNEPNTSSNSNSRLSESSASDGKRNFFARFRGAK